MAGQPITSLERLQQGLLGGLGLAGDPVQAPLQLPAAPQGVGLATPAPPPQAAAVAPPAPAAAPAAGMGMGLAQAPQGATDPTAGALGPAPTDLSDLPAIQKALLLFGELGNALQNPGTAGPAQQMLARRKQEYESKRKAFADGVQVLEQFRSVLDRTPAKDLDKVHAQLKARWAQLAPGMEALFDATLGDPKDVAASLQPVLDDEGGKALFASGRTVQELGQYYASPEVQKRLRAEADAKTFAPAKQKLQDLLATKDPRIQKILKDAQGADGVWTLDEIRAVNEQLPESLRLSNSELVTLDRNEVGLNDLGRNFRTREAIALETQEQIKSDVELKRELALIRERAKWAKREAGLTGNVQVESYNRVNRQDKVMRNQLYILDRVLDPRSNGIKDVSTLFTFIQQLDGTAVRESEVELAARAAPLAARIRTMLGNYTSGDTVPFEVEQQIRQELRIAREQLAEDRDLTVTSNYEIASELGATPAILRGYERLMEVGKGSTVPEKRTKATEKDVERVMRAVGDDPSAIERALEAEGLDL